MINWKGSFVIKSVHNWSIRMHNYSYKNEFLVFPGNSIRNGCDDTMIMSPR